MMTTLGRVLCSLAMLVSALPAQAAIVLYTSEASYLAAVGVTRTYIDFAGSPLAVVSGGSFSPDVTFGSCTDSANPGTCGTNVFHSSDAITDLGGSVASNGVASVAWRFNLPDVFAFGFNYVSGGIMAVAIVNPDLSITLVDTSAATGFIGLVADSAFYGSIAVNAVIPGVGHDRYFIDDFRISALASVPEPGALALVAIALAVAALVYRSRAGRRMRAVAA